MITENEKRIAARIAVDFGLIQDYVNKRCIKDREKISAKEIFTDLQDRLQNDLPQPTFQAAFSCAVRGGYIVGIKGKKGRNGGYSAIVESINELPEANVFGDEFIAEAKISKRGRKSGSSNVQVQNTEFVNDDNSADDNSEENNSSEDDNSEDEAANDSFDDSNVDDSEEENGSVNEDEPVNEAEPIKEPVISPPKKPSKKIEKAGSYFSSEYNHAPYSRYRRRHVWVNKELIKVPMLFDRLERLVQIMGGMRSDRTAPIVFNGRGWSVSNVEQFREMMIFHGGVSEGYSEPIFEEEDGIPVELKIAG